MSFYENFGLVLVLTETSLILLSEELTKKNCDVFFANKTNQEKSVNGVHYINEKNINKEKTYDLAIAVSNANLFKNIKSSKKAIFSVSNQTFEKFFRNKVSYEKIDRYVSIDCDQEISSLSFFLAGL